MEQKFEITNLRLKLEGLNLRMNSDPTPSGTEIWHNQFEIWWLKSQNELRTRPQWKWEFKMTNLSLKYDSLNLGTNLITTPKPLTINTLPFSPYSFFHFKPLTISTSSSSSSSSFKPQQQVLLKKDFATFKLKFFIRSSPLMQEFYPLFGLFLRVHDIWVGTLVLPWLRAPTFVKSIFVIQNAMFMFVKQI